MLTTTLQNYILLYIIIKKLLINMDYRVKELVSVFLYKLSLHVAIVPLPQHHTLLNSY